MAGMLEGKVAIVTGAGHGIGRGHALELARHGAAVVVNDLGTSVRGEGRGRDADEVVELIESRGGRAAADYGDVSSPEDVDAMVATALERFGQLDVVVNNAGIVRDKVIWNMAVEDFDLVMAVHVRGTWLLSQAAAKHWRGAGQVLRRADRLRPDHQHHLGSRALRQLRPVELRSRQGGDRRA